MRGATSSPHKSKHKIISGTKNRCFVFFVNALSDITIETKRYKKKGSTVTSIILKVSKHEYRVSAT